jgi:hypothetical protein
MLGLGLVNPVMLKQVFIQSILLKSWMDGLEGSFAAFGLREELS